MPCPNRLSPWSRGTTERSLKGALGLLRKEAEATHPPVQGAIPEPASGCLAICLLSAYSDQDCAGPTLLWKFVDDEVRIVSGCTEAGALRRESCPQTNIALLVDRNSEAHRHTTIYRQGSIIALESE